METRPRQPHRPASPCERPLPDISEQERAFWRHAVAAERRRIAAPGNGAATG